jgi:glutamate-ammonia-ligase adenylyltransferase
MGKLGGHELTYRSDLDLIYLYEENTDQEYYTRLGTRVISALSLLTREGYAYKIDTALRPSGNAGTLVSTLLSFQEYHQEVGRIWEKQALIKARPLQGLTLESVPFEKTIERTFDHIVYQPYDPQKVAQEINHLRNRMEKELAQEKPGRYQIKTGRGGIVDIEFATQFLQLIHGYHHKNLKLTSTVLALRSLAQEKILVPSLAQFLEEAYLFYRILETRLRLILDQPTDNLIEGTEWIKKLEDRFFGGKPLIKRYLEIREEVRSIYKKMLNL